MTLKEFKEKYTPIGKWCRTQQASWDLFEEIVETLEEDDVPFETNVGSCSYKLSTMMEICDKSLPDYEYMKQMQNDLKELGL